MNINFKSDFALIVTFEDGVPDYPWQISFSTKDGNNPSRGCYTAQFDGANYLRAHTLEGSEESSIVIEFVNHSLPVGVLQAEWSATRSSELFESGEQQVVTPQITSVTLVKGVSDDDLEPEVLALVMPVVKCQCDPDAEVAASSLNTDCVTIDNDGIFSRPSPSGQNNVLGELIGFVEVNDYNIIVNQWVHPSEGEESYFTSIYSTSQNKIIRKSESFYNNYNEYRVLIEPYQPVDSPITSTTFNNYVLYRSDTDIKIRTERADSTTVFGGFIILIYGCDQFISNE